MAVAALRFCATPGCSQRVPHGHCATHRSAKQAARTRHQWGHHTRLHGTNRWRRMSKAGLAREPWCVLCHDEGKRVLATVRDHIKPARTHPELFFDEANHRSVCHYHNSTRPEEHSFGR